MADFNGGKATIFSKEAPNGVHDCVSCIHWNLKNDKDFYFFLFNCAKSIV